MKLNLGCGNKKKDGFIGVDKFPCDAVDVISDLSERLPFEITQLKRYIWIML